MSVSKATQERGGDAGKPKRKIGSPIEIKSFSTIKDEKCSWIEKFLNSASAEEQLGILKTIIDEQNDKVIEFLSIVFYEAPAKHPIKHFLVRHVTKCTNIQESFTQALTGYIKSDVQRNCYKHEYNYYSERVPKIMLCVENFPAGALAVQNMDFKFLARNLFVDYFINVRNRLRKPSHSIPSPTEKNEMFKLDHVMVRLMVYMLQNSSTASVKSHVDSLMYVIVNCIKQLIEDEELPMDTKLLSGILLLLLETLRHTGSWRSCKLFIVSAHGDVGSAMEHRHGRLAVYCALASLLPPDQLQESMLDDRTPDVLILLDKLLHFAQGSDTEGAVVEAVSRGVEALSRALPALPAGAGGELTARLLPFVWSHLDHSPPTVRHRAMNVLANCLHYCALLDEQGASEPLEGLAASVRALGSCRTLYWAVSRACSALGAARTLVHLCAPSALLAALNEPDLQAAASAAISSVLSHGACDGASPQHVYCTWVRPALHCPAALQAVLPAAIRACPPLTAYIGSQVSGRAVLSMARAVPACRALVSHRALRAAALHRDDETRILALSLVCERDRTTEVASREDLDSVLWFLRYNIASPRPALRTALLHYMNKLFKRLEDSHRALSRNNKPGTEHYAPFIEQLREFCFKSALPGASHGRRNVALQLLAGVESVLPAVTRVWKAEYVATLLLHLEDSYDSNKEYALEVLQRCPIHLLEDCSSELTMSGIVKQAASSRTSGGAAAAAKLHLLLAVLSHRITSHDNYYVNDYQKHTGRDPSLVAAYCALRALLKQIYAVSTLSVVEQAAHGGAAGTLRCMHALLSTDRFRRVEWSTSPWSALVHEVTRACVTSCEYADPIVSHEAPEGHLPAAWDCAVGEQNVTVTSQMVLVCAWRTIKEGSAVLSVMAPLGGVSSCVEAGCYLVSLLGRAMHRGAVEQAAVALHTLAHQCWSRPKLCVFPRRWLRELLTLVVVGAPHATRRGAGLPHAIQALVSSEVTAVGRDECLNECMQELFKLAAPDAAPDGVPRRTLAANILRALFRHSALERGSQVYISAGLQLAIQGFEAAAWPERTAMSLLFCALFVRTFGVARARGSLVHARNTMHASLFLQRYPLVYDLIVSKLQCFEPAASSGGVVVLPALLVLARLQPSAATRPTVCGLVPLVQRCACAAELRVRQLAARALPALLLPTEYESYIERLLTAISRPNLQRNHWHGALLTLACLLERAPTATLSHTASGSSNNTNGSSNTTSGSPASFSGFPATSSGSLVSGTLFALEQATGAVPCYVIAREYVNVFNLLLWKYPAMVDAETISRACSLLARVLSDSRASFADRELCLADCTLLHYILLHRRKQVDRIVDMILTTLGHDPYEVSLSTLDYLLIQHADTSLELEHCNLRAHLLTIRDDNILRTLRNTHKYQTYLSILRDIYRDTNAYIECRTKCLRLLTLEDNTQELVINKKIPSHYNRDEFIANALADIIDRDETLVNVKHMYLESVFKHMSATLERLHSRCFVNVLIVMFVSSTGENTDSCRMAVVQYLERDAERIMRLDWNTPPRYSTSGADKFICAAAVLGTLVCLLEDEEDDVRQRAADTAARLALHALPETADVSEGEPLRELVQAVCEAGGEGVTASAAGELVLAYVARMDDGAVLLLVLALLQCRAEVRLTDPLTHECRVFDQSERYNMFLEESVWTSACAELFAQLNEQRSDLIRHAVTLVHHKNYSWAFRTLCGDNVKLFVKMANGETINDETLNPKIEILIRKLREHSL